jgi:hypothetical protein
MSSREISDAKNGKSYPELPKWFTGELYNEGAVVTNPFSGYCYTLNNVELSMYDFVWGCSMHVESLSTSLMKDYRRGLDWFRRANPEAYYVLLD